MIRQKNQKSGRPFRATGVCLGLLIAPMATQAHAQPDDARMICSNLFPTREPVIGIYLQWIRQADDKTLIQFRSNAGDGNINIRNPRVLQRTQDGYICRFDITSTIIGGNAPHISVRNLDFRFTQSEGASTWELISFPPGPAEQYTDEQIQDLIAKLYIGDKPYLDAVVDAAVRESSRTVPEPRNALDALNQKQSAYDKQLEEYARDLGLDVDAMKAAEEEETRLYAEQCRQNGGTWGQPLDKFGNAGRLGCYYPTGER